MTNEGSRVSNQEKRRRGTFRGDRATSDGAPLKPTNSLLAPDWMTDDIALDEWQRVAPELQKAGTLASIHQSLLAAYCMAVAQAVRAEIRLGKEGRQYRTKTASGGEMRRRNPAVADVDEGWKRARIIADKLGITDRLEGGSDSDERRAFFR